MTDFVSREEFLQLSAKVTTLMKWRETADSPWWKRLIFRLDGWPRAACVADGGTGPNGQRQHGRSWRPWHRWFYLT